MIIKDILKPYKLVADLIIQSLNWGSLTFSHNEITSACNISLSELGHLELYCYWQTLFERLNVWQWHQASNLTPIPLITLSIFTMASQFVNSLESQVTVQFHWCTRWAPKILQVAALMTVLHVGNKTPALQLFPTQFFFWKPSFW